MRPLEPRLRPVNGLIALITGEGGWPRPLGDKGFELLRVELPIATPGVVVVDVLAGRAVPPNILACEAKSGDNIVDIQAQRYAAMRTLDVRRLVTAAPDGPVRVLYACNEASQDRIAMGLRAAGVSASILSIGPARAVLIPAPGHEELAFSVGLPGTEPPAFIPLDQHSPDSEYREVLIPTIVACAARGLKRVTLRALCEEGLPYWTHLPGDVGKAREQVARQVYTKAFHVLTTLAPTVEFRDFFAVEPHGRDLLDAVIHIQYSPADNAPQGETQGWQALQRKAQRTMRGRVQKQVPGQLSFEDLARREGVGSEQ